MLYRLERWVVNTRIGRLLGRFHHRVDRSITGMQPRQGRDGVWIYPLMEATVADTGLQELETYVSCRQNTVAQYILTRTTMDRFLV